MYVHKKWIRFKHLIPIAVILPLVPSIGLHVVIVWTDLACGMSVLWLTYVLVRIFDEVLVNHTASRVQQISFCVQLCMSLVLAYFIRSNSFLVYLVMAPVLALLFILKKNWKLLITISLSVMAVLLIRFPGYNALNVQRDVFVDQVKYFAGMHDIQATYYDGGTFSNNTVAALRQYIPRIDTPKVRDSFHRDFANYNYYAYDAYPLTIGEFASLYVDSFIRNPFKMARAVLFRIRAYWVIDPKEGIGWVNYTNINGLKEDIGVYRKPNFMTKTMNLYLPSMSHFPLTATFVWRYGVWVALMLVSMMVLVYKRRYVWLLMYLPVFVYLATLYMTNGWTDYRYGLSLLFVGLFLPAVSILSDTPVDGKNAPVSLLYKERDVN